MNSYPLPKTSLDQAPAKEPLPFENNLITLTQAKYIELKWQSSFWKTQYEKSSAREEGLKEKLKQSIARISNLKQHLNNKKELQADYWKTEYETAIAQEEILRDALKQK